MPDCSPVGRRFALACCTLFKLSSSVELVRHLWKMLEKFDIYSKIFYRDVEKFVRYLCLLVLRHQMRVSNYFVNSFYSVCWAYAERILSHTEHTRNEFHRMLSILGTACAEMFKSRISLPIRIRFLKISCYRPLGPYGFGFCKKSIKKNSSCLCTFKHTCTWHLMTSPELVSIASRA